MTAPYEWSPAEGASLPDGTPAADPAVREASAAGAPTQDAPARLRFGYGTNGLTDLRLDDALGLLADLGYSGVGLTLDHMHLDPLAPDLAARTRRVARRLDQLGLTVTVETGARYVLDPRRKHGPSLLDPDPQRRAERASLLIRAVQVATDLGAHAVHCFSGITPDGTSAETAWSRLTDALQPVLDAVSSARLPLAVEPEPGHLLATLADFHHLRHLLGDPELLGLTLDIGHCQCLEPQSPADCVRAAAPWLRHVQIEDMRRGVHEHLPFGDGEIDFPPVLRALAATGYQGLTVVELPRHSHAGPQLAARSMDFLHRAAAFALSGGSGSSGSAATPTSPRAPSGPAAAPPLREASPRGGTP
ncbi:sugar phosphate isomerase/epimerase family protein [Streptomyces spectabilis]|uniref:Sugar phosphate isomerase/epimerase n=1 Tax=Streptomyces spectabilis TaxID=68270 RepID=A0A5P2XIX2_STRST|nr:sugar phosphate isomerase/epimerase family protein [Streptomyces spectabilis]MBB5107096.1 sugar phosphate isomerase/epimerase [Streptomyces spectabilis]MCI3906144.1 sugar phosphate isomerase/epimerase [Streptomyces spectabilis]QEV63025.1 sugar phosphate isomerase/epimerase [Streptomyces spectabilis]GGV04614.1 xylose isomerase [Streptomyces spectabilis]